MDPGGLRDRRRQGAHDGRPARQRLLGEVVPGRLGQRDARADPALVLLAVLHVVSCSSAARRTSGCSATRRCSTSSGREMHGSWGNMIDAEDAFARMGADVMRWQYCAQPPDRNLLFGFGPAHEIKRKLLTFWNSAAFLVNYANIAGSSRSRPTSRRARRPTRAARPLARRADPRARPRGRGCLRGDAHRERDPRVRGVRRRPLELVHPPLAPALLGRGRRPRSATLWYALVQSLRVIAPVMPFLADHLWWNLVARPRGVGASRRLARGAERRPRRCSRRSRRCARSSSSAGRRARPRGSSCASRCAG